MRPYQNLRPYQNFGPFEIPRQRALIDQAALRTQFWRDIDSTRNGLSKAKGCYVFAMSAGRGYTPWYVGKANGANGFSQEAFNPRNINTYNEVMNQYQRGRPVIFFVARMTPNTRIFAQNPHNSEISYIENMLIAFAAEANSGLRNKQGLQFLRECIVPGMLNSGSRAVDNATRDMLRLFNLLPTARNGGDSGLSMSKEQLEEMKRHHEDSLREIQERLDGIEREHNESILAGENDDAAADCDSESDQGDIETPETSYVSDLSSDSEDGFGLEPKRKRFWFF